MSARRNLTFYATALIGTALGTAAALLLAPKSGEDTRKQIRRMAGELSEQLPVTLSELKLRGRQVLDRAPRRITLGRRKGERIIQLYRENEGDG